MSRKHLHRYVTAFAGRNNARRLATVDHMALLVLGGEGKSLTEALDSPQGQRW